MYTNWDQSLIIYVYVYLRHVLNIKEAGVVDDKKYYAR